jgi:hypothetical protein
MNLSSYPFSRLTATRYIFISEGKKSIEKIVEFTYENISNTFNVAFGDLLPDGSIDDMANSNNGDIIKVLSTVSRILQDFTDRFPESTIFFAGSTEERTMLYRRILKTHYSSFKEKFDISALIVSKEDFRQVVFEPAENLEYNAFLIKRIS